MSLLARVGAVPGAVHVQDHVVAARPAGHALDRGPPDHQVDHDDDRAELAGELRSLVHVLHGSGRDVEIGALDLTGRRTRLVDRIHHVEKAVAPVHEGLRVDVLVVLHEIEPPLQALVDHPAVVAPREAELGLGGRPEQRATELVEPLALDDEPGRRTVEGLDVGDRDPDVLEPQRLERLEAEHVADEARRHVGDRALLEKDDVVGDPGENLAGIVGDRLDLEGLGAVAVARGEPVGPHDRPGGRARLPRHRSGRLDRIYAVLRRDAEQADRVGGLGHVVRVPVAHLPVLDDPRSVAALGVRNRRGPVVAGLRSLISGFCPDRHRCGPHRWVEEDCRSTLSFR